MNKKLLSNEDLCVCCGTYVPEGRMICPQCETFGPTVKPELTGLGQSGTGPGQRQRRRRRRREKCKRLKFGVGMLAVFCAVSLCLVGTGNALSLGRTWVDSDIDTLLETAAECDLIEENTEESEMDVQEDVNEADVSETPENDAETSDVDIESLSEIVEDTEAADEEATAEETEDGTSEKIENKTSEEKTEDTGAATEAVEKNDRSLELTDEEMYLVAAIVYLEARGECAEGQQAVAEVIFNRVQSSRFPNTIKEVIYQDGQFESLSLLSTAKPGEAQYTAVWNALEGDRILPANVVYFGRKAQNSRVWGTIGSHVFCYV